MVFYDWHKNLSFYIIFLFLDIFYDYISGNIDLIASPHLHRLNHPILGLNLKPNSFPMTLNLSIKNSSVTGTPFTLHLSKKAIVQLPHPSPFDAVSMMASP